jgi:hypothetical protein
MGTPQFSRVPVERRKVPREDVYCIVKLKLDDGSPALRCMLVDLTSFGARVSVSDKREIPEQFTLLFAAMPAAAMPPGVASGTRYRGRVRVRGCG